MEAAQSRPPSYPCLPCTNVDKVEVPEHNEWLVIGEVQQCPHIGRDSGRDRHRDGPSELTQIGVQGRRRYGRPCCECSRRVPDLVTVVFGGNPAEDLEGRVGNSSGGGMWDNIPWEREVARARLQLRKGPIRKIWSLRHQTDLDPEYFTVSRWLCHRPPPCSSIGLPMDGRTGQPVQMSMNTHRYTGTSRPHGPWKQNTGQPVQMSHKPWTHADERGRWLPVNRYN